MRVAFITHYTQLYGANRSLLNLIDGLREYDVVPHVVAPEEGDITRVLRERGVPVAIVPIERWIKARKPESFRASPRRWIYMQRNRLIGAIKRLVRSIRILPALVKQLRAWNIDLVYTNSSVTPVGAMAAFWLKCPHVWHLRELNDLHYGLCYDWGKFLSLRIINKSDAQVAISETIRRYYLEGARHDRMRVIYNGVASVAEYDRLHSIVHSQPKPADPRPYVFAIVGQVYAAKGQHVAVQALALLARDFPGLRLLVVGSGQIDEIKELAAELGVEHQVELWGFIEDPYRAYLAADAVLMCSQNEGMGRVTVEAMSACRPVIGYDQAGTSEVIEHGKTGLFYRGGPEELAGCMRQFVENPAWARELGERGWHVAREKYSVEACARSVYKVLASVTQSAGIPYQAK